MRGWSNGAGNICQRIKRKRISGRPVSYTHLDVYKRQAIKQEGIVPREVPIRGGTDGSILSGRGLPCPNISTGYQNGHSVYEYVSTKALETCARICINLAASFVK